MPKIRLYVCPKKRVKFWVCRCQINNFLMMIDVLIVVKMSKKFGIFGFLILCRIIQKAYISWNSGNQIYFSPELPIDIDFSKCFANFVCSFFSFVCFVFVCFPGGFVFVFFWFSLEFDVEWMGLYICEQFWCNVFHSGLAHSALISLLYLSYIQLGPSQFIWYLPILLIYEMKWKTKFSTLRAIRKMQNTYALL